MSEYILCAWTFLVFISIITTIATKEDERISSIFIGTVHGLQDLWCRLKWRFKLLELSIEFLSIPPIKYAEFCFLCMQCYLKRDLWSNIPHHAVIILVLFHFVTSLTSLLLWQFLNVLVIFFKLHFTFPRHRTHIHASNPSPKIRFVFVSHLYLR
jgi:hypothetical protein